MKKTVSLVLAFLFIAIASVSFAATANFSWTINPLNADGTPANVVGTVERIYQSSSSPVTTSGTLIFTSALGTTSTNSVTIVANCGATYYFATTSTADGNTSAISDTKSSVFACSVPGKPIINSIILFK